MLRIIQIRIPKTATTSIEAALKVMRNEKLIKSKPHDHAKTPQILNRYTPEDKKNAIVLASVRNPYDRLVSAYQYIIQFKKDKRNKELKYVFDFPSFRDFAMNLPLIFEKNQFFHPHCRWLYKDDKKLCNFIIRYETLSADWNRFVAKYKLKAIELPVQRKTKRKSWREYYDDEAMKVVHKVYEEDFRRLNYNVN